MNVTQKIKTEVEKKGESIIRQVFDKLLKKEYEACFKPVEEAQKLFMSEKSSENISICFSLSGFLEYICQDNYFRALTFLDDAKHVSKNETVSSARLVNQFLSAEIDFSENNFDTALLNYEHAKKIALKFDEYGLLSIIQQRINEVKEKALHTCPKCLQSNTEAHFHTQKKSKKRDPLAALLKISQTIAAETNIDTLLAVIAEETKAAILADRCSVFLYDKAKDELWSKVALGMNSQEIRFPAGKGLAGYVAKTGEAINIKDAYNDDRFNKEIDLQTGYRTETILCMPIKNMKQEIIGVFQVLNKLEGVFSEEDEDLLIAIGSSAGISLENAQLFKQQQQMFIEQKQVFDSFIDTLATSIDARDKITAGHSTRVKMYSSLIAKELKMDEKMVEVIEKAATLHDIGKIGIRDSVLQKDGKLTDEEYKHIQEHVEITHNILEKIHMSDEFKLVTEIACSHHEKFDGNGYYRKLKGEDIPFGGRILAVSDVFDAITSKRHYRDKMPIINVINILLKDSGTHFDKSIVDCFLSISLDKLIRVFLTENEMAFENSHCKTLSKYCLMDLFNLCNDKPIEEMSGEEKNVVNLFNLYYTAKSNEENPV